MINYTNYKLQNICFSKLTKKELQAELEKDGVVYKSITKVPKPDMVKEFVKHRGKTALVWLIINKYGIL